MLNAELLDANTARLPVPRKRGPRPGQGGRPAGSAKLQPDAGTLNTLSIIAEMFCTQGEAAALLRVSRTTFETFLRTHKSAREVWDRGLMVGRVKLRQLQFKLAMEGNVTMLIWLGKQYLGQSDKRASP